jgi:fructokinase
MKYYIGLDIGGTKVEAVLLTDVQERNDLIVKDTSYTICSRERIKTERDKGYPYVLANIGKLILSICDKNHIEVSMLAGIGVGLPGSVDPKTQIMLHGNSAIFEKQNFKQDLQDYLKYPTPIFIDNDANLFALAEVYAGAGLIFEKQYNISTSRQNAVGIIIGTGCGGGIILNGEILQGRRGGGGEIGHTQVQINGDLCYCGRQGCAELYLSGSGIELQFEKMTGQKISAPEFFDLVNENNSQAITLLEQTKERLAYFIANLVNILDCDYLVLGGGVSNQTIIYQGLQERVQQLCFVPNHPVEIYSCKLGDSAGVFGAAMLPILKM